MSKELIKKTVAELISAYETSLSVHICVNSFTGNIIDYIPRANQYHNNPCCACVKGLDQRETRRKCSVFDNGVIPATIKLKRGGVWKWCHGDLLEYVAGLYQGDVLNGKISFGQFRPGQEFDREKNFVCSSFRSLKSTVDIKMWNRLAELDRTKQKALEIVFDHLAAELSRRLDDTGLTGCRSTERREKIDYFIGRRLGGRVELSDLARELDLSVSRTGVVVRELYGESFAALLRRRRMDYAADLLKNTALNAVRIASLCGFEDPAYFHRCFKHSHGLTTRAYRRQGNQA